MGSHCLIAIFFLRQKHCLPTRVPKTEKVSGKEVKKQNVDLCSAIPWNGDNSMLSSLAGKLEEKVGRKTSL